MTSPAPAPDLQIRPLRADDDAEVAAVAALLADAYRDMGHFDANPAYEESVVDVAGRAQRDTVLVAVRGDDVVGTATVASAHSGTAELATGDETELRYVGVRLDVQGGGIATALVAAAEDTARSLGSPRMVISVISWNTKAARLYEQLGYLRDDARTWWPVPTVELVVSTKEL
ncbi:MAG: GNAT family N-acetyltransferase [Candidatus Nanopelagicales bacterium]